MANRSVVAGLVVTAGCSLYGDAFHCASDEQCSGNGVVGTCESTGFCAFPDSSCVPPFRYGDHAGSLSNQCVSGGVQIDARPDSPPGESCYGTGFVNACFAAPPTGTVTLTPQTIDTDTSPMCSTLVLNSTAWCVIAGQDVSVAAGTLTATGSRPLVLIATSTLSVTGTIDVASHRAGVPGGPTVGAGAVPPTDTTRCDPGVGPGASGGGAGGSFGARGGDGGDPNHGAAGTPMLATALRGGCAGQDGATGTPGAKGIGGGAIYLFAGTQTTVMGAINASGGAGTAGVTGDGGGGGGGAGGMIAFDSPMVNNLGLILANGGGGAEGAGNVTKGSDGNEPGGIAPAPATSSISNGGEGGNGGAAGTGAGTGVNATAPYGGGGGGGAVGVIKLFQATNIVGAGGVSPNPS